MRDMGACVCKTGYVPSDGTDADEDSDVDCQKMVYQRCGADQQLDSNGVCRAPTDCWDECNGEPGAVEPNLGVCRCESSVTAREACGRTCTASRPRVTFTSTGDIKVTEAGEDDKETYPVEELTGLAGRARCHLADAEDCELLSLRTDADTGDFMADFGPPPILGLSRRAWQPPRFLRGAESPGTGR